MILSAKNPADMAQRMAVATEAVRFVQMHNGEIGENGLHFSVAHVLVSEEQNPSNVVSFKPASNDPGMGM